MIHPSELRFGGEAMTPLVPHFCIYVSPIPVAQTELSKRIPPSDGRGINMSLDDNYATVYDPIINIYPEDESWWFGVDEAAKVMDAVVHIVLDSEKPCDIRYALVGLENWIFRDKHGL